MPYLSALLETLTQWLLGDACALPETLTQLLGDACALPGLLTTRPFALNPVLFHPLPQPLHLLLELLYLFTLGLNYLGITGLSVEQFLHLPPLLAQFGLQVAHAAPQPLGLWVSFQMAPQRLAYSTPCPWPVLAAEGLGKSGGSKTQERYHAQDRRAQGT